MDVVWKKDETDSMWTEQHCGEPKWSRQGNASHRLDYFAE